MKKNKGFTLIELLAVIIVLAIIALIATPIITNVIKNSKKNSALISGTSYIKQVENTLMKDRMENGRFIKDGKYDINADGNLTGNGLQEPFIIPASGKKPSSGTIIVKNGLVDKESSIIIGDYEIFYDENKGDFIADVKLEIVCNAVSNLSWQRFQDNHNPTDSDFTVLKKVGVLASDGNPYALGVEYSCDLGDGKMRTFYVLEDGDTTTLTDGRLAQAGEVSLIADSSFGRDDGQQANAITISCGASHLNGAHTAVVSWKNIYESLQTFTKNWTKINQNQISLPTAYQLAQASGQPFEDDRLENLPLWLFSHLYSSYWTSTLTTDAQVNSSTGASEEHRATYAVSSNFSDNQNIGYTYKRPIDMEEGEGIRPVITISKRQINPVIPEPTPDVLCTLVTETDTPFAFGTQYSCDLGDFINNNNGNPYPFNSTFYVLEDGDNTTLGEDGTAKEGQVSLILNKNLGDPSSLYYDALCSSYGGTVTWCKDGGANNSCSTDGAIEYLQSATSRWGKIDSSQITLPTRAQLNKIQNLTSSKILPTWLKENLKLGSTNYGYWTSTPVGTVNAYYVYGLSPQIASTTVTKEYGVRPVITISKENISY